MVPQTRAEFKKLCLQNLGAPVIEINGEDEQWENRISQALAMYKEYHFDATEKTYFKYQLTSNNFPDRLFDIVVHDGGTGYSNSDTVTFTATRGAHAAATINTYSNGTIQSILLSNNGVDYTVVPTLTITTSGGSGANVEPQLGGWIPIPENILGVVNLFDLSSVMVNPDNMFSAQYQIMFNEIWNLSSSSSMVPYYTTFMHLALLEQLLIGQKPIRYTKHRNRMHIDMNWNLVKVGNWIVAECYEVIDPAKFPDVWSDKWLQAYATCLFKLQWGNNTKKFQNMPLTAGITFNGQITYDEAIQEKERLEFELVNSYSIPAGLFIG